MDLPINKIICGDCIEVMKDWPGNCIDTIITDPPYALGFLGKDWDTFDKSQFGIAGEEGENDLKVKKNFKILPRLENWQGYYEMMLTAAKEMLRIAKPGAFLLCFGGTRTYHRLTCAIEDAGWQIRDCMMWLYGSGFPKSLDISKAIDKAKKAERRIIGKSIMTYPKADNSMSENSYGISGGKLANDTTAERIKTIITTPATDLAKLWDGWGTALKPAYEPIVVAMKPPDGTFAETAEKWGVSGLNIDGGRISFISDNDKKSAIFGRGTNILGGNYVGATHGDGRTNIKPDDKGRWPANVILDEEVAKVLDEQSGERHAGGKVTGKQNSRTGESGIYGHYDAKENSPFYDSGGASRFFYIAKASRDERNEFLEGNDARQIDEGRQPENPGGNNPRNRGARSDVNFHPTVKPLKLIEYLCKLTKTPGGGGSAGLFRGQRHNSDRLHQYRQEIYPD